MYNLEQILLEAAKSYLKSLSDAEFLALTCNLTTLHDGLIRLVHNQSLARHFRARQYSAALTKEMKGIVDAFVAEHPDWEPDEVKMTVKVIA